MPSSGEQSYSITIRAAVRGLWMGALTYAQALQEMELCVRIYLRHAWMEAGESCGVSPADWTERENWVLQSEIFEQARHVGAFLTAVAEGSRERGGKLGPLLSRCDSWVARYGQIRERGKSVICADRPLEWVYGDTIEHCVPKGTVITTRGGGKPIEDIGVGDQVLTRAGWQRVDGTFKRCYGGDLIEVSAGQRQVSMTPEHRVLTRRGWVKAESLEQGQDAVFLLAVILAHKLFLRHNSVPFYYPSAVMAQRRLRGNALFVYNLSIKGKPEFFANGILLHNCRDCSRVAGRVYRLSTWDAYGWVPGSPELACGGWRCRCSRVETDRGCTPGRPPAMRGA